ncbi:MAG: hypothetical protein ACT6QT_19290 [Sphingopyxis sp.]|jgi:hypothetical protein|uniref:hypothetical protein n=1 Tax=Sphingopyxis sp. TaxID=1908224 RepID=UPI003F729CC8
MSKSTRDSIDRGREFSFLAMTEWAIPFPAAPRSRGFACAARLISIDLLANLADVGADTGVQRPIPTIRLIGRLPKRMGGSADRRRGRYMTPYI